MSSYVKSTQSTQSTPRSSHSTGNVRPDERDHEWLGLWYLRWLRYSGWHWTRYPSLWPIYQHRSGSWGDELRCIEREWSDVYESVLRLCLLRPVGSSVSHLVSAGTVLHSGHGVLCNGASLNSSKLCSHGVILTLESLWVSCFWH